jgi:hypothetical protein
MGYFHRFSRQGYVQKGSYKTLIDHFEHTHTRELLQYSLFYIPMPFLLFSDLICAPNALFGKPTPEGTTLLYDAPIDHFDHTHTCAT